MDGLLRACDEADGLKDGMIFNTTACRFDPKTLVCDASKSAGCLTAAQADAIEKGFAGPKDSKGRAVYPGFPFDTGINATQGIPGLLHGGSNPVGPPFSSTDDGRGCSGSGGSREPDGYPDSDLQAGRTSTRSPGVAASSCSSMASAIPGSPRSIPSTTTTGSRRPTAVRRKCANGAGCIWRRAWGTVAAARPQSTPSICCLPSSTGSKVRSRRRPSGPPAVAGPAAAGPCARIPRMRTTRGRATWRTPRPSSAARRVFWRINPSSDFARRPCLRSENRWAPVV